MTLSLDPNRRSSQTLTSPGADSKFHFWPNIPFSLKLTKEINFQIKGCFADGSPTGPKSPLPYGTGTYFKHTGKLPSTSAFCQNTETRTRPRIQSRTSVNRFSTDMSYHQSSTLPYQSQNHFGTMPLPKHDDKVRFFGQNFPILFCGKIDEIWDWFFRFQQLTRV